MANNNFFFTPESMYSPEQLAELAILQDQDRVASESELGLGLRRALHTTPGLLREFAGVVNEPFDPAAAKVHFAKSDEEQRLARRWPSRYRSWDEASAAGDRLGYVAGRIGENAGNVVTGVPAAALGAMALAPLAGGGLAGLGAGAVAGGALASAPSLMGEMSQSMRQDPALMANTSPVNRLGASMMYAAPASVLEALPDALLAGRLSGAGQAVKSVFKDGVTAGLRAALGHTAKALPEAMLTEGVPEVLQQRMQQNLLTGLNPARDKSGDAAELKESFIGGTAAGVGSSGVGRGADVLRSNVSDLRGVIGDYLDTKVAARNQAGATDAPDDGVLDFDALYQEHLDETEPVSFVDRARNHLDTTIEKLGQGAGGLRNRFDNLFKGKQLPDDMQSASDEDVLDWDKLYEESRREEAASVANDLFSRYGVSNEIGKSAARFLQSLKEGAGDWTAFAGDVKAAELKERASAGVARFIDRAKQLAADGLMKIRSQKNDELTPEDGILIRDFANALHSNSTLREEPDRLADVYSYVKQALLNGDELPFHALSDEFGGEKPLTATLKQLHDGLVRAGQLEPDDSFESSVGAKLSAGASRDKARVDAVMKNLKLEYWDSLTNHEVERLTYAISDQLDNYGSMTKAQRINFDARVTQLFGKNADRALEALRKDPVGSVAVNEDTTDGATTDVEHMDTPNPAAQTIHEVQGDETRFVGSASKNWRVKEPSEDDGGFWALGHENGKTRREIRTRMSGVVRDARATGARVKVLNPVEYAKLKGVSAEKVAEQLKTTVDQLPGHPARMLQISDKTVDRDTLDFSAEDIAKLASATVTKLSTRPDAATAKAVADAFALTDAGARIRALRELGLTNVRKLERDKDGNTILKHNLNHVGEGRFTVVMRDGTEHTLTAQNLINLVRKRSGTNVKYDGRPEGDAALMRDFLTGVSSITANPDVVDIKTQDVFGNAITREAVAKMTRVPRNGDGSQKEPGAGRASLLRNNVRTYGRFGNLFKLFEDNGRAVTMGGAHRSQVRGAAKFDVEKDIAALIETQDLTYQALGEIGSELEALNEKADLSSDEQARRGGLEAQREKLAGELEDVSNKLDDLLHEQSLVERDDDSYSDPDRTVTSDEITEKNAHKDRVAPKPRSFQEETGEPLHPRGVKLRPESRRRSAHVKDVPRIRVPGGVGINTMGAHAMKLWGAIRAIEGVYGSSSTNLNNLAQRVFDNLHNPVILRRTENILAQWVDKRLEETVAAGREITGNEPKKNLLRKRYNELKKIRDSLTVHEIADADDVSFRRSGSETTPTTVVSTKDAHEAADAVHFSKEQDKRQEPLSPGEKQAIEDYITKVLGPNIVVEFVKVLRNPNTNRFESGSAQWFRKNGRVIVQIVANAANPMSKAHHESMHEFFQRLMDDNSEAATILRNAANSAAVVRQLEQFFHDKPAVRESIKNSEHERVAYMFQLWMADKINLGPKTETLFQKIANFLRKALGMLSEDQRAEEIMRAFSDGKMSTPSAVAETLAKDPAVMGKWLSQMRPVYDKVREHVMTTQNTLIDSGNPILERIGRMFSHETGHVGDGDPSFFEARTQKENQMLDRLNLILKGADATDAKLAWEGLQTGKMSSDEKIATIQKRVRKMLDQMHEYVTAAGVKIDRVADYIPRAWDTEVLMANAQEFIDKLRADYQARHGKQLDAGVARGVYESLVINHGAEPLAESDWHLGYTPYMKAANSRKIDWIDDKDYAKFMRKDMIEVLSTYIAHAVHRAEYARRFENDGSGLRAMLMMAVGHEVDKRVGAGTWAKAEEAARAEVKAKAAADKAPVPEVTIDNVVAKLGTKARAVMPEVEEVMKPARRSIMAMEGTLGSGVSEEKVQRTMRNKFGARWEVATNNARKKKADATLRDVVNELTASERKDAEKVLDRLHGTAWRRMSSNIIVYENMRTLPLALFAQFIDPLGIVIRGGTFNEAYDAFKLGMVGAVKGWRKQEFEGPIVDLCKQLGIIDVSGALNTMGNMYASPYQSKRAKWFNDKLFRWNGVEMFAQGTRIAATKAAISFIKTHADKSTEHSQRYLEELYGKGVDPKSIKRDANGELDFTDKANQAAIMRWVDGAILRPNAAMRPAWASDPHWALIFHMKQFTYAFQKVILERIATEVKHGNYDPAFTAILAYVPVMIAADTLRGLVSSGGDEPAWKKKWTMGDYLAEGVQRSGLLGIPQLGVDVVKWGPAELAGPAASQVSKAAALTAKELSRHDKLIDTYGESKADELNDPLVKATKNIVRDALPVSSLSKRYVYDPLVE